MPETWRARVIEEHLRAAGIAATVRACDIYALDGEERHAVLDAMVRDGAEPPMVLVRGRVACVGDIDFEAVCAAAREAL
jgi:hypothetical protein